MTRKTAMLTGAIFLAAPLLVAGQAAAQTCMEPPSGMLGWWPGDGNGDDAHSNLNASVVDGAGFSPGLVGEAFALDGISTGLGDRVYLPASALNGVVDMTVEMWINTSDPDDGGILSGANGNPKGDNELVLFQYEPASLQLMVIVKGSNSIQVPIVINDGQWHHLAFTRAHGLGRVYVDGSMLGSMTLPAGSGAFEIGPGGLMLGQEQDCLGGCYGNQAFDGLIDEVTIYGRGLSHDEILGIVDAGAAGKCKAPAPPSLDELMERMAYLESDVDMLHERVADLEADLFDQGLLMEEMLEMLEVLGMGAGMGHMELMQELVGFETHLNDHYDIKMKKSSRKSTRKSTRKSRRKSQGGHEHNKNSGHGDSYYGHVHD
jgi:hypothetical protein